MVLIEARPLLHHHDPLIGHMEAAAIFLGVEADLDVGRHLHAFVDDGAAHAGVAADHHLVHQDRLLDVGVAVDTDAGAEHATIDAPAGDDAAFRHQRVGGDAHARVTVGAAL